jgi:hypothetical protein
MPRNLSYTSHLTAAHSGYDRQSFWAQARAGIMPNGAAVLTLQKASQGGSDMFHCIHAMHSADLGETWSAPVRQPGLERRTREDGTQVCPCDGTPAWHQASGKMLLTGHLALYAGDHLKSGDYQRETYYSVFDPDSGGFGLWQTLRMPDLEHFFNCGAGCTQRVDLANGEILLPVYFHSRTPTPSQSGDCAMATVVRCAFDGETLTYLEHGDELVCPVPRGFGEPSLTAFGDRFYLTLRNDEQGYVTSGEDGLHFHQPRPWCFDDGEPLGNYNTQQHWITHSEALFLVYTRRAGNNDHVMRHRAPLFMAQIDPDRLCAIRDTERIVVPERGARLGNFGTVNVGPEESWVVVSEWMQTTAPNPYDGTVCESYGSDNSVFVSRIRWERPNRQT